VGGIVDIVGALVHRIDSWGWHLAGGLLSVIVALIILANPVVGTIAAVRVLYLLIATSALVNGVVGLFSHERSLGRIVLSVFQIAFAILMLIGFFDIISLIVLVQSIGLVGIGGGIASALSAFRLRHTQTAGV
jgi:hypothetical protein